MSDLLLSNPRYLAVEENITTLQTLQRNLEIISSVKKNRISVHAEWSVAEKKLQPLLAAIADVKLSKIYCVDSEDLLDSLLQVVPEESFFEVSLRAGSSLTALQQLKKRKNVSFFLPLEAYTDAAAGTISQALEIYPEPLKIEIGVGWRHRLSGPLPIPQEEHEAWAEHVLSLVQSLAQKSRKLSFACGLKLCMFSRLQLGELAVKNVTWPIAFCPRPFLFKENGDIRPCVRLPLPDGLAEEDIRNLDKTADSVSQWLSPYLGFCYDAETLHCRSLNVKSCSTGCLEHSLEGWQS